MSGRKETSSTVEFQPYNNNAISFQRILENVWFQDIMVLYLDSLIRIRHSVHRWKIAHTASQIASITIKVVPKSPAGAVEISLSQSAVLQSRYLVI